MCGIAGMIGLHYDDGILEKMHNTMLRRGPDATGLYQSEECVLLHSRLAVIDPKRGSQPMGLDWAGEQYILIYNGELYNTEELRRELLKEGHTFLGHSDTEVILHAYVQWGEKCLDRFNGIFAFAVWEKQAKKLFLARDRMGVKPVFYKLHEGGFLFASELKTILRYPTVKAELDTTGIAEILLLGPGRMPGSGVFHGIAELEPGCCGTFHAGKWRWRRYWQLKDGEHTDSFEETVEKVRFLVLDAIRRQTVSDVPLGTFLSGGLDSSLISAICAKEMADRGERLHTFSVDYENNDQYFVPGKFQPNSDNSFIEIMRNEIDSEHHWTVLTPQMLLDALEEATIARDLPGMADVDGSLLAFCKDIRKHVKVALSGECADEIFGGYPWYRDPEVRALDGFPWAQNTAQRARFLTPEAASCINGADFVMDTYRKTLAACDILPGTAPEERRMKEMVNLNLRWFMQTLLDRKDRMSMYSGLEVRVPFCDYRIAEYLYTVPWKYKDYRGKEKGLLRYAMADTLPEAVLWRKKSPYPKTYDPRYFTLVSDRLRELLNHPGEPIFRIVNRDALTELLTSDNKWPWYGQLMKTPQTVAYMLMINIWLKAYNVNFI